MNRLIIIGAGGHGKVAMDIAQIIGYDDVCFLADNDAPDMNVVGRVSDFDRFADSCDFFVAVGNNSARARIQNEISAKSGNIINLIHPNAFVSSMAKLGLGVIIMAGAVVNADAVLGDGVIVNTCASVDHDCTVGDFAHVSVGAHLAGTVMVGEKTFIGAGATVINNISICDGCTIGAGAVVVKNITEKGTYVGVPAKLKK